MADEKKKSDKHKKSEFYQAGEKLSRTKKFCPKCGPGVFLAEHKDRVYCGKCAYTEWTQKEKPAEKKA